MEKEYEVTISLEEYNELKTRECTLYNIHKLALECFESATLNWNNKSLTFDENKIVPLMILIDRCGYKLKLKKLQDEKKAGLENE